MENTINVDYSSLPPQISNRINEAHIVDHSEIIVDAGNFISKTPGIDGIYHPPAVAVLSWRMGVDVVDLIRKKGKKAKMVYMVGDLGLTPAERQALKKMSADKILPKEYADYIKNKNITTADLIIYFESNLRNKAARDIKSTGKSFQSTLKSVVDDLFVYVKRLGEYVYIGHKHDNGGIVALCTPMLSRLTIEKSKKYKTHINIYAKEMILCEKDSFVDIAKDLYHLESGALHIINIWINQINNNECTFELFDSKEIGF